MVCEGETVALSWDWTGGASGMMRVDDDQFTATWGEPGPQHSLIVSGVIYTIVAPTQTLQLNSAGRSSGFLTPGEDPGVVTLTLITIPRRYADYPEAMAARRVFSGRCEGLF